jgi:hypothetical protein
MAGGRPTTDPRTVLVSVRLAPRHKRMLEARARAEDISISEALRRFLDEARGQTPARRARRNAGRRPR